jgi:hypothetical protein
VVLLCLPYRVVDRYNNETSFELCTQPARKSGFRRFRMETLRRSRAPRDLTRLWLGHSKQSITDFYGGLERDEAWRRECCERAGLGFSLVGLLGLQKTEKIISENSVTPMGAERRSSAPGEIRTPDPLVRSQMLYPAELRARSVSPSTIPRYYARLQLRPPDFVAHVAQLSPAPR